MKSVIFFVACLFFASVHCQNLGNLFTFSCGGGSCSVSNIDLTNGTTSAVTSYAASAPYNQGSGADIMIQLGGEILYRSDNCSGTLRAITIERGIPSTVVGSIGVTCVQPIKSSFSTGTLYGISGSTTQPASALIKINPSISGGTFDYAEIVEFGSKLAGWTVVDSATGLAALDSANNEFYTMVADPNGNIAVLSVDLAASTFSLSQMSSSTAPQGMFYSSSMSSLVVVTAAGQLATVDLVQGTYTPFFSLPFASAQCTPYYSDITGTGFLFVLNQGATQVVAVNVDTKSFSRPFSWTATSIFLLSVKWFTTLLILIEKKKNKTTITKFK